MARGPFSVDDHRRLHRLRRRNLPAATVVYPAPHLKNRYESKRAQELGTGILADEATREDRREDEQAKTYEPREPRHPQGKRRSLAVRTEAQGKLGQERGRPPQQARRAHDVQQNSKDQLGESQLQDNRDSAEGNAPGPQGEASPALRSTCPSRPGVGARA